MEKIMLKIIPDDEDPGAFVMVDGYIEDKKYEFLLDTGAATSEICYDSFTSKFNTIGSKKSSGAFSSDTLDLIKIRSIKLGNTKKENFTLRRRSSDFSVLKNLIGMDFLKDLNCLFLFNTANLIINPPIDTSVKLSPLLMGPKYHPYVSIKLGNNEINTVWDSGASITVVDQHFIDSNPNSFKKIGESIGTDATGQSKKTSTYLMDSYEIYTNVFPPTEVVGVDLTHINSSTEIPMTMILGYTTLCNANWLFDFPKKRFAITEMLHKKKIEEN